MLLKYRGDQAMIAPMRCPCDRCLDRQIDGGGEIWAARVSRTAGARVGGPENYISCVLFKFLLHLSVGPASKFST